MTEITHQEVHALLTETANHLAKIYPDSWAPASTRRVIQQNIATALHEKNINEVVSEPAKSGIEFYFELNKTWFTFEIDYKTHEVRPWLPVTTIEALQ